ncbi:SLC5 family protein [Chitinophaga cymbidii]|uniref:Sodium transporter n=1 Tax=Chitinophaga cymbidii TaxID=1096750 RepID=A0A512RPD5_9BACT|nr:sodium/solute symporter [Chitinophaga cymbidii]GEP97551.1 sodium transporter [Chitinophaga cymbidii]
MEKFHLSLADILIVVVETLLVVVIGLIAAKKIKRTTEGYFLAAGNMPWYLIGAAFVATSVSSEQIVGTMGATYKGGLAIANWEWWALPTYLLMMIFFIPMYLRNRIVTVPELLNRRFGPLCGAIYSIVILIGYIFVFLPPVIYGGSVTISELTGWDIRYVMAGIVLLTASYTLLGGLSSVMWTDAIQCLMLIVGGVLFFFVALDKIPGGWGAMVAASPERFHLYMPPSSQEAPFAGLILASFGVFLFYQSSNQVMIQRVLSARSTWDGMMGIIFSGFINLIRPLVTCLLGLIVYHWLDVMKQGPSLLPDQQDKTFPLALELFAPSGLKGVILAGFFAAVMSSISALANSIATIFSLDVYKRFWRKRAGDRELIITGQMSGGMALFIGTLIAPLVADVGLFKYFQTGVTYMATPFIAVLLMGLLWKRTTYAGAIAGLIGGVLIQLGLALLFYMLHIELNWLYVGAIAEALTILLIAVVSLMTPAPPAAQAEPFLWKLAWIRSLNDDDKDRPWFRKIKFWLLIYALAWCYIYWRFW